MKECPRDCLRAVVERNDGRSITLITNQDEAVLSAARARDYREGYTCPNPDCATWYKLSFAAGSLGVLTEIHVSTDEPCDDGSPDLLSGAETELSVAD